MSDKSIVKAGDEIMSEACAWNAQLDSGEMSAADFEALREWMNRSPAHAREMREIVALSGTLAAFTELAGPLEQSAGAGSTLRKPSSLLVSRAYALVGLCLVAAVCVIVALQSSRELTPDIYMTAVGEYRTIALEDGSSVKLNTNSQVEVSYNDAERRIRLIHGEALFDVAKNKSRPFVVYSEGFVAKAIGTSFVVRLRDSVTELAVVEGSVAFSRVLSKAPDPSSRDLVQETNVNGEHNEPSTVTALILKSGQIMSSDVLKQVERTPEPIIPSVQPEDLQRRLSWTEGLLDFSRMPLEDVVAEVSRYTEIDIEIAEPALEKLELGGVFRTGDVDAFLEALERFDVSVDRIGDEKIVIRQAAQL